MAWWDYTLPGTLLNIGKSLFGNTEAWDKSWGQEGVWGNTKKYVFPGKYAAQEQQAAAQRGLDELGQRYEEGKGYIQPFYEQGLRDYQRLGNMVSEQYQPEAYQDPTFNFEADPGYQFRKEQGLDSIRGSAAAQGNMLSGATLKALQKYGSGLASQEYGNAFNRFEQNRNYMRRKYETDRNFGYGMQQDSFRNMAGLANVGTSMATQLGNMAIGQGTNMYTGLQNMGTARANEITGQGEDLGNLFNLLQKLIPAMPGGGAGGGNPGQAGMMTGVLP